MALKTCRGCGKEYDRNAYGAGRLYCTTACRHTKGGTIDVTRKSPGRKARFPKCNEVEVQLIIDELQDLGFHLKPRTMYTRFKGRSFYLLHNSLEIPITIGGADHYAELWAKVLFHYRGGELNIESTCRWGAYINREGHRRVTACGMYTCPTCVTARMLKVRIRHTLHASKSKTGKPIYFGEGRPVV